MFKCATDPIVVKIYRVHAANVLLLCAKDPIVVRIHKCGTDPIVIKIHSTLGEYLGCMYLVDLDHD